MRMTGTMPPPMTEAEVMAVLGEYAAEAQAHLEGVAETPPDAATAVGIAMMLACDDTGEVLDRLARLRRGAP